MSDPVSWFLIERGWKVAGANGGELGTVDEVVGDSSQDIFDGLSVSSGLFATPRYLPAESVTRIEEGTVYVDLADLSGLDEFREPPPSEKILPSKASWWDRLRAKF
jgi:PRC-barrel domain protein